MIENDYKILFIDDDDNICKLANRLFTKKTSYSFDIVKSFREAKEYLLKNTYNIVISDYVLSENETGLDILKFIKEKRLSYKFILISGFLDYSYLVNAINQGADKFLPKPVNWEQLLTILKSFYYYELEKEKDVFPTKDLYEINSKITFSTDMFHTIQYSKWIIKEFNDLLSDIENSKLTMGYNELILNAIEHGNLGIDSIKKREALANRSYEQLLKEKLNCKELVEKKICVKKKYSNGELVVSIADEGNGFNTENIFNSHIDTASMNGRGIKIAQAIFDKIEYNDKGNIVTVSKNIIEE